MLVERGGKTCRRRTRCLTSRPVDFRDAWEDILLLEDVFGGLDNDGMLMIGGELW